MQRRRLWLLIACGGVAGSTVRWIIAEALDQGSFPWATFAANVVGSALLGVLLAAERPAVVSTTLGTGFCGGLTTFSTFSLEVVELAQDDRTGVATIYLLASLVASVALFVLSRHSARTRTT